MISMPAIKFQQSEIDLYVGVLAARDIVNLMIVDRWHREEGWNLEAQGYQREIFDDHISGIRNFLTTHSDEILPTTVLATVRDEDRLSVSFNSSDGKLGSLEFQEGAHIYIIDGQHRLIAFYRILQAHPTSLLGDYLLPLTVIYADKVEELRQFYLINDRQRRISTSLAYALLATAASDNERVARSLVVNRAWRLPATKLAIALCEDPDSPWNGRVKYPNDLPDAGKVATLNSLANSLSFFASNRDGVDIPQDEAVDFLCRFWGGIKLLMPSAFDNPGGYNIQRGLGGYAMNLVAYQTYRQRTDLRNATPEAFCEFLQGASDYFDPNKWVRRGVFASEYRGDSRMRTLGREILTALGLAIR